MADKRWDNLTIAYLLKKVEEKVGEWLAGKVSKSGDTMTGYMVSKNQSFAIGDTPASQLTVGTIYQDKNGNAIGFNEGGVNATGGLFVQIGAQRVINSTNKWHHLRLVIAPDGTATVEFGQPDAWKTALGIGSVSKETTRTNIITPGANITISSASYAQWGKVAMLFVNWKSSNQIYVSADGNATNVNVGTVVSGKRPAITTAGTSYGDNGGPAFYYFDANGSLQLGACGGTGSTRYVAANTEFQCCITYLLA